MSSTFFVPFSLGNRLSSSIFRKSQFLRLPPLLLGGFGSEEQASLAVEPDECVARLLLGARIDQLGEGIEERLGRLLVTVTMTLLQSHR
jgi:hypothetical protein